MKNVPIRGRFGYVGGLVNWSAVFVEAIFVTAFALNHSSKVFIVLTTVNSLKHVCVCARVSWPTAKDRGNGLWQA